MITKKAQTEILGLSIIVVLILIGLGLYFRFQISNDSDSGNEDITDSILAKNIVGAMLDSDADCRQMDFRELIISCTESHILPSTQYCGTKTECSFLEEKVNDILNKTLKAIKKENYEFLIELEPATGGSMIKILEIESNSCYEWRTGIYNYNIHQGNLMIKLRVCE